MIRHIVFFTFKEKTNISQALAELKNLANIKSVHNFIATLATGDADVVVCADFESRQHLQNYIADSIYTQTVTAVKPLREHRICADIKIPSS